MNDGRTQAAVADSSWHTLSVDDVLERLGASPAGLSSEEADRRLAVDGPNELQHAAQTPAWRILAQQFANVLILILLAATALSALLGHGIEAIAITVIVMLAVLLGFIQEYRAERAMEALSRMAAPMAHVLRDGDEIEVESRDVVAGDITLLQAGNRVPADARLIEAVNLKVSEAALTGESLAVEKTTATLQAADLPVGDRRNLVYAGTTVAYGRGRAVVVTTGMRTEFGRIAGMLQTVERRRTPLQRSLDRLGGTLARAALGVVLLIVVLGLLRGQPFIEMLVFGIALAVAVVPEALPAVVTISLAIGVQRLIRRRALMRRLTAVETLGSTSFICADKTGTLTEDQMTVRSVLAAGRTITVSGTGYTPVGEFRWDDGDAVPGVLEELLTAAALASDAHLVAGPPEAGWELRGDPTEGALVVAAAKAGIDLEDVRARCPRIDEIPFSSESKRMTTLHDGPEGRVAFVKGAPEVVVEACDTWLTAEGVAELAAAQRQGLLEAASGMADRALRVLAIARRRASSLPEAQGGLTLLGLVGMIDPPRPEARAALRTCRDAGIRVVMITGDHPITARAVARELGLDRGGELLTAAELEQLSDSDLERRAPGIDVYARVSPEHKLRVIRALQRLGHVVAMTGDGVNDAPALKKADIGVAMGISGTDVAREAAAMTLTDDNFASIVAAVEEGRGIFGNIKKYLTFLLSSNIGEIGLMAAATIGGMPLPLSAVQILYVNLATDGLPALALAVDPPESDLMSRPPRDPKASIFSRSVIGLMVAGGVWSMLVNLAVFAGSLSAGLALEQAMTLTFVSLILIQFFKAYNFRSDHLSVLHRPFANKWLNLAIGWEIALLIAILYVPFLQVPFETFGLGWTHWAIVIGAAATVCPVLEVVKWRQRD